jgi:hypothetical protein
MATDSESFNRDLYDLLKVRGYKPVPLDSKNQRVAASQDSDVIEFQFTKAGDDYGKVWATVDDAQNLIIYYDGEQQDSPSTRTPGVDYDDTWTGLLKFLKMWAQRRQMSFELSNKDRLGDDMRQRDYYKMKEKLGESYHSMGKKASYNDAVPNVKIVLQHNRALEEGEQRYRNIARIYLENVDGERFLAPTNRPGIARVYARHIAEGGLPNDDRWNHIKSICEDYNKMAGFVRATRNGQFNESAQELVTEGINHYNNLRESLHKMTGHRGYQAYFESWTPTLMENEGDESINELFVQETMDPRIESAMPILSRLRKPIAEMNEVDALAEWADGILADKLDMNEAESAGGAAAGMLGAAIKTGVGTIGDAAGAVVSKVAGSVLGEEESLQSNNPQGIPEGDVVPFKKKKQDDDDDYDDDDYDDDDDDDSWIPSIEDFEQEEAIRNRNREYQKHKRTPANDVNEMDKSPEANPYSGQGHRKGNDHAGKPQHTAKMMAAKDAVKAARKALDKAFKGDVEENFISMAPQAVAEVEELDEISRDTAQAVKDKTFKNITGLKGQQGRQEVYDKNVRRHTMASNKLSGKAKVPATNDEVEEGLDANQKRVGQLGPTEKVKNNNIGKLVGANESTEIDPELARIIEMARFKR